MTADKGQDKNFKLWPKVGMAACQSNESSSGGAYRAWRLAHHYCPSGSGKVDRDGFYSYLDSLGINRQTRWRWVSKAIDLGLISEKIYPDGIYYYLVGLAKAAAILGCREVGLPAYIEAEDLIKPGWRAIVYAAWLTTIGGGPMSQEVKEELTGVIPRTQRNYLERVEVKKQKTYAKRDLPAKEDYLRGFEEVTGLTVFINEQGETVQRLPDIIAVPDRVARKAPKGRSRKAQRELNATSFTVKREQCGQLMRLFYNDAGAALKALRSQTVMPGQTVPGHLFLQEHTEQDVTWFDPLPFRAEEVGLAM